MSPALPQNPILSDLAFANLPWRAAVRESLAHGRLPLWNRFVLAGSPLLGTAQAGVLHPSTWLGIWLPVPLSWTFSCTFTLFLGLLAGFLFFGDFGLGARAALVGAVGWGFSTYVVFWNGWSVGPSTATFPLLLLGLRRLAREPGLRATGLDGRGALPLVLRRPPGVLLPLGRGGRRLLSLGASRASRGASGRARPGWRSAPARSRCCCADRSSSRCSRRSRTRRSTARAVAALGEEAGRQSVAIGAAAARLLPDALPFAHGIYGKSRVEAEREDGSGMPIGYAGAMLFPLAALAFAARPASRGRGMFAGFALAGLAYGASFPGVMDLTARLPGFALALNYRLVFLAGPRDRGPGRVRDASTSRPAATRAGSPGRARRARSRSARCTWSRGRSSRREGLPRRSRAPGSRSRSRPSSCWR